MSTMTENVGEYDHYFESILEARINNYFTIFSIPAICIIPSVPKNKALCNAFVILTIIYIIKTTIDHANSYLYIGYLDFHTIIF